MLSSRGEIPARELASPALVASPSSLQFFPCPRSTQGVGRARTWEVIANLPPPPASLQHPLT